jgi:hypothetical protein
MGEAFLDHQCGIVPARAQLVPANRDGIALSPARKTAPLFDQLEQRTPAGLAPT